MKINLRSITFMLGLLAIVSIMVPTQTQIFGSTEGEPDILRIREVGNNDNEAEMAKMTVKEGNQPSEKEDDFELDPEENAIFVPQGKNVEVTDDENFFRAVVTRGDDDKQIPISQQGIIDLKGLQQGFYYLDVVIQDGNRKIAYEAILFIGPDNDTNRDTVNKEVNRVDKEVTITKRVTNFDKIVQCGKDQKFNDRTKKCENIPPPCKPNEVRDNTGKCVPKTPSPKPQPPVGGTGGAGGTGGGPGESCTLSDGRPGRVTGTQAQGNLNCISTADNRGATTAPTGPAGSDCSLPGGNTGGKVTNTPNGLACIAGTKPPTPPAPAGGGPTEPRAPAGTTPGSVDPNIAPTLNPVCKPGQQSTPQAPCKPGITVPGPGQPGSPGGPPDATGFQRLPDGTLVFPKGTQQVVCPQPQSSGAQCVKLPASLGGLTIPVMGLTTRPDGSLSQAPAPSLTGPGGPLDPNNPPGKVFPECPPGGPITSDCVAGPNTFKTPQAGPAPGAQSPIAGLSPAPAPAPGQTPQTGAAGTGVPPGPVQGPPTVPDSPADAWPVGTTLTRYPDGTLVAAPPGGKAIMLKPTASGGIYMPSQNPDGTINIASPLGFQVKPGSVNIAPSGLDPAQGRPVPVESLPKATTTAPAQPVEPTEPGGVGPGTGGAPMGFVEPGAAPPTAEECEASQDQIPGCEELNPPGAITQPAPSEGEPPGLGAGQGPGGTDTAIPDPGTEPPAPGTDEPEPIAPTDPTELANFCADNPQHSACQTPTTPPDTTSQVTPVPIPEPNVPDEETMLFGEPTQGQGTTDMPAQGTPCPAGTVGPGVPDCEPIPPTQEPSGVCESGFGTPPNCQTQEEFCSENPNDERCLTEPTDPDQPTPSPQPQDPCVVDPEAPGCPGGPTDPTAPNCLDFPDDPRCPQGPPQPLTPLTELAPQQEDTQTCDDGSVIPADDECPDPEELEIPSDEEFVDPNAEIQQDFSGDATGGDLSGGDGGEGGGDGGDGGEGGDGGDGEE